MLSKFLLFVVIFNYLIKLGLHGAKICYQCDDKNPSPALKFWGEKITRCNDVPIEKYSTKTSRAFGASVLTCFTRFNESGAVIKRGAYGLGETYDKNFKCRDRFHICCRAEMCNKHDTPPCPPSPRATPKQSVKACYQCKGADACRAEKISGSEIRTSGAFGGKNLYCYTKFDPKTGEAVARGAFGFGEAFDKNLKCDAKHYLCCYENMCNNQTAGFCVKTTQTPSKQRPTRKRTTHQPTARPDSFASQQPYRPPDRPNDPPYRPPDRPNDPPYRPPDRPNDPPYRPPDRPNDPPYRPPDRPNDPPYRPPPPPPQYYRQPGMPA